ncbi:hypothetical protein C8R44DRAFT_872350 [Mycena epipterygia]|nr:hypothetical protein C8R44DRAFT_872350 [Mycena epipterygia]
MLSRTAIPPAVSNEFTTHHPSPRDAALPWTAHRTAHPCMLSHAGPAEIVSARSGALSRMYESSPHLRMHSPQLSARWRCVQARLLAPMLQLHCVGAQRLGLLPVPVTATAVDFTGGPRARPVSPRPVDLDSRARTGGHGQRHGRNG